MYKKVLITASVASMIDQFNRLNIRLLQEMGYEVHVACNFTEGNTCDAQQIQKLREYLGAIRVVQHQWDCPRGPASVAGCIRAYRQMLALTGRHRFAWMHCHSPVGGALSRLAAHRRGLRAVYTAHGFHFYRGAPKKNWMLYYPAEKLLAQWTDVLVTINREDYLFAKRNLRARAVVHIPGVGVDAERFGQAADAREKKEFRRRWGMPADARVLLSVGELSSRKNHRLVLSVLPGLAERNTYYMVCGQGSLREELLREAETLGVRSRIRLAGFQEDAARFYRNVDIFVLPSVQEGLPAALMEAMAAGLPCVASDIRGNRDLVGRSCCFPLAQPQALAEMLARLLDNAGMRRDWGVRNRRRAAAYSREAVEKRLREVYMAMQEKEKAAGKYI